MTKIANNPHTLITGASSGIGQALALAYAQQGHDLTLTGRNPERLEETATICRSTGASVHTSLTDVTDCDGMKALIQEADGKVPLSLVIANAGIGETSSPQTVFATNITGVMNTIMPALDVMKPRRNGQIALMASAAGFRGLPSAPAYCASKACIKVWGEGLRGALATNNIRVSVILPGFVESRITAVNPFPMPFLMPAKKAAHHIVRGLAKNKGRISFPWPVILTSWLLATLPDLWADQLTRRFPQKPRMD
ncbi:SDR family NAD(P)-dependent oxidoreductase [Haematospirillum jordaniae]|uniref:Short-chain dehydrogenase n=1 Tax=Haematospirillum jordaniae TaxID=1549855 RepID=A0A143DB01_9PROT|nr:SDR family NAD(P)-dependent oxidoreductase [Haematospirillum jordaniae]AMW33905.1 short-chain dehydrogenase [Haematospirillum jordaniae]NKD44450.1 SDR family NAD(P)-dependent oxidoreductase [Haematospirillum jordaniae]NKD57470.1 SDR family NAD(P)-dependent oxidoreductase [Haematospirillum jordaniae]NKD59552.1 SDR family NAD(P)-dependent oxidoreductase [Haematospirillum jordaniae]NKD67546.1 SDR family NAD(P)-dependent oxidoreductase [Haematospirillum jordaniae]